MSYGFTELCWMHAWSVGTILLIYGMQKIYSLGGMVSRNHSMLYGLAGLYWMHGIVCGNHIDYIWCTEDIHARPNGVHKL
jgi:hypothetical protein